MSLRTGRARRVAVVVGFAMTPVLLSSCFWSSSTAHKSSTTTPPAKAVELCPLTGTRAPGNVVPRRPALAVKIDNYSLGSPPAEARPQSGLNYADDIFEEQVEGGITRYVAVFQCRQAPIPIGPVRSARVVDIGILSEFSHPLLVHVGGIAPVIARIDYSPITNVDLGNYASLNINPPTRFAPYDTYTRTQWIWSLFKNRTTPPAPIFTYSKLPLPGRSVTQIHLDWSITSDIWWRWDKTTGTWLRFYDNAASEPGPPLIQPDLFASGVQNQAQNVVIQVVHIYFGPWLENFEGGKEVQAHIAYSSGRAFVFRNGKEIPGVWTHGSPTSPTIFKTTSGKVIGLAPGRTWVEVYPSISPIQIFYGSKT
jgi:hypothetical protein